MKNWFNRNSKNVLVISYIIPIIIASILSISHVVSWYDITNPISWAVYLSIGIEIAALSALAGIITKVNKYVYIPFILVTFIQFVGNVFYGYQYIDVSSQLFQDWVELTAPLFDWMNFIDAGNTIAHKRLLAFIGGGLIPVISLSFLHLLVSTMSQYEYEEQKEKLDDEVEEEDEIIDEDPEGDGDDEEDSTLMDSNDTQDADTEILSGGTEANKETINSGTTEDNDMKYSGSTEEEEVKEQKGDEPNKKRSVTKEDLPEFKNKNRRRRGGANTRVSNNKKTGNNIQRIDDGYGKKRTE